MARFFTSDLHLGSTNINKYANRPFFSAEDAVVKLCQNANTVVGYADSLIHVGDFMLTKSDKHDEIEDIGLNYKKEDYLAMFKSRVFLLAGNHDDHNACESDAKSMTIDLNQNYHNVYVSHYPSDHKFYCGPTRFNARGLHIVLCGHVHDKWILKFDMVRMVLNVNIGVDCWSMRPVRDAEITELLDYFRATMWTKINPAPGKWINFTLTRDALDKFKIAHSKEMQIAREQRKQEKHAKKGLTPEICEQRRIAAMKAKGLI